MKKVMILIGFLCLGNLVMAQRGPDGGETALQKATRTSKPDVEFGFQNTPLKQAMRTSNETVTAKLQQQKDPALQRCLGMEDAWDRFTCAIPKSSVRYPGETLATLRWFMDYILGLYNTGNKNLQNGHRSAGEAQIKEAKRLAKKLKKYETIAYVDGEIKSIKVLSYVYHVNFELEKDENLQGEFAGRCEELGVTYVSGTDWRYANNWKDISLDLLTDAHTVSDL